MRLEGEMDGRTNELHPIAQSGWGERMKLPIAHSGWGERMMHPIAYRG